MHMEVKHSSESVKQTWHIGSFGKHDSSFETIMCMLYAYGCHVHAWAAEYIYTNTYSLLLMIDYWDLQI